jgi:hypothetical protein
MTNKFKNFLKNNKVTKFIKEKANTVFKKDTSREDKLKELYSNMEKAKENYESSPEVLKDAEKKYYNFKYGENYYKKREMKIKLHTIAKQNEVTLQKTESQIREEKLAELNNKLLQARSTYETGPEMLKTAEESYYIFKDGEDGYKNKQFNEYKKEAKELHSKMKHKHNKEMKETIQSLSYYDSQRTYINNVNMVKLSILKEIRNKLNELRIEETNKHTNDRKTFYILQEQESLDMWLRLVNHVILAFVIVFIIYNVSEAEKENINIFTYVISVVLILVVFYLESFIKWIQTIPLSINVYAAWGEEKTQPSLLWSILITCIVLYGIVKYSNNTIDSYL